MKMKRLLAAFLLLALLCTATALAAQPAVVDQAGLFTAQQKADMEIIISDIRETYQIDGVVLTTRLSSMSDSRLEDYADRYFEDNGYGLGDDRSGFLVMIDMGNRYVHISTAGVMIDYLNDRRIEHCLDTAESAIHTGKYGVGVLWILGEIRSDLAQGIEEGSFRFDRETGKRLSGLYNKLTAAEALVGVLAGLAAAVVIVLSVCGKYNLAGGTYRFNKSTQTDVKLRVADEQFLRQTVTRHRTPPPSSGGGSGGHGGSSVHRSSGGMSHGGGGRHF